MYVYICHTQSGDVYSWKDIKDAISDRENLPERITAGVHQTDVLDIVAVPPDMVVSCSVCMYMCVCMCVCMHVMHQTDVLDIVAVPLDMVVPCSACMCVCMHVMHNSGYQCLLIWSCHAQYVCMYLDVYVCM